MPTTAHFPNDEGAVMTVMIGVDPHKGSHTAVAVDETEQALGDLKVRSGPAQLGRPDSGQAQPSPSSAGALNSPSPSTGQSTAP